MNIELLIQDIVKQANDLKNIHTNEVSAQVNYVAIFSQTKDEYKSFLDLANKIGKIVEETPTGPLFQIEPLDTVSGTLKLLKIRSPDTTRKERGDADFTVSDYIHFKKENLSKPGFKLIEREDFEMIELMDENFNVRAYFSNPPLDQQLCI